LTVPPRVARGDVWLVDLSPTRGREQAGRRPGLVVSVDLFNQGPADLVVVIPLTTKDKGIPLHVAVNPPEGGVRVTSFAKCEDVRSIAKERLSARWGTVAPATLAAVEDRLRILLGL
jgi:mRNA interferase MazF